MSGPSAWQVYAWLMERARRDAGIICGRPEVGEDALQEVMGRVSAGDLRCLRSPAYFRACVVHQVYDILRRDRRYVSLDGMVQREDEAGERSGVLRVIGLICEPEAVARLIELDRARQLEVVRKGLRLGLERIKPAFAAAATARLRQWLVEDGGEEAVRQFEAVCEVDLGPYTGTAELAQATGQPPGTVACHATRGLRALAKTIEGLIRD